MPFVIYSLLQKLFCLIFIYKLKPVKAFLAKGAGLIQHIKVIKMELYADKTVALISHSRRAEQKRIYNKELVPVFIHHNSRLLEDLTLCCLDQGIFFFFILRIHKSCRNTQKKPSRWISELIGEKKLWLFAGKLHDNNAAYGVRDHGLKLILAHGRNQIFERSS